jgi:hypothetical protein
MVYDYFQQQGGKLVLGAEINSAHGLGERQDAPHGFNRNLELVCDFLGVHPASALPRMQLSTMTRESLTTHAPLHRPGTLSTSGHFVQSIPPMFGRPFSCK